MKRLTPYFTNNELPLKVSDITGYIKSREDDGVKPSTINKELGLLSAAINWANRDLEWDYPNPVLGRKLREPEGRIRWIEYDDAIRLIEAARTIPRSKQWLPEFIQLGLYTGMRRGEMLGLQWSRVDLKRRLITLESHNQKSGKFGTVPLSQKACKAIFSRKKFVEMYCQDSEWVFCDRSGNRIANIRKGFASARVVAGIEDFTPHDLRHTCASWMVQAGVSIPKVAEVLRHSDIRVTMRYAHLSPENARDAVNVLDQLMSQNGHSVISSTEEKLVN